MLIYLPCCSVLLTYFIFQSKGIDFRAVALGSLIPMFVDFFVGHASLGHSFLLPVIALVVVMLATIGRPRLLRRRILCVVIGMFFALVLEGTFLHQQLWWWPSSLHSTHKEISIFPTLPVWLLRDAIGLIALYIITGVGDLYKPEARAKFYRTGRIESVQ